MLMLAAARSVAASSVAEQEAEVVPDAFVTFVSSDAFGCSCGVGVGVGVEEEDGVGVGVEDDEEDPGQ